MADIYTLQTLPENALTGYRLVEHALDEDDHGEAFDDSILLIKVRKPYGMNNFEYAMFKRDAQAHLDYIRRLADWLIAEMRDVYPHETAYQVLIPFHGGYCTMEWSIKRVIEPTVRGNGLVAETWEYEFSQKVHAHASYLSNLLGKALLVASGCADDDLNELAQGAAEAVADARRELYGY
jgi:hypothetical protein